MSEELKTLLATFRAEFGNPTHIRLLEDLNLLTMMEARPTQTKATLEKMKRLDSNIVWMIKQSKKL